MAVLVAGAGTTLIPEVAGAAVTQYGDATVSNPTSVIAGADGALWFTKQWERFDRSRHHRRHGLQLCGRDDRQADGHCGGIGRRAVVYEQWQQLDRPDHDRWWS